MQLDLVPRPPVPSIPGIDLVLGSCTDFDWPEADLVIADGPWSYVQKIGATRAENHYDVLTARKIAGMLEPFARLASRMACWLTWPIYDREWVPATMHVRDGRIARWAWGPGVSGGSWHKPEPDDTGHYGQGYHWAGCSEPIVVYTSRSAARKVYTNRKVVLRNAWSEAPGEHSEKPIEWQAQWIRRWCPPGGRVLEPFAGRGSGARATILAGEGRTYVGTELSEKRYLEACALAAALAARQPARLL